MHTNTAPIASSQPRTTATACFHRDVTRLFNRRAHVYAAQTPCSITDYIVAVESTSSPGSTDLITSDHTGVDRGNVVATVPTSDFDAAIRTLGYNVHPVVRVAKATLCYQSDLGMGWHVVHVRDVEVTVGPYAQYVAALHVRYTRKGARNVVGFTQTSHPTLVILDGWVDVKLASIWAPGDGMSQHSRGRAFDEVWDKDFDTALASVVADGAVVVRDYRGHNSHGR